MVADAVEDAVGIRFTAMPITAERVALAVARREEPSKWAST
jgi:CO/xanthine dehydrogenase Mo-binding subunit